DLPDGVAYTRRASEERVMNKRILVVEVEPFHTLRSRFAILSARCIARCAGLSFRQAYFNPWHCRPRKITATKYPTAAAPTFQAGEPLRVAAEPGRSVAEGHELIDVDPPANRRPGLSPVAQSAMPRLAGAASAMSAWPRTSGCPGSRPARPRSW